MEKTNCSQCNKEFLRKKSQLAKAKYSFCSKDCYTSWLKGRPTRFNIAEYLNNNPEVRRRSNEKKRGRPLSEEHRKKLSVANIRIGQKPPSYEGVNHPRWIGGTMAYYKKQAKERDNFTCQCVNSCWWHEGVMCRFRDKKIIEADHIIPLKVSPEKANSLDNIMTLCPNCHSWKTHHQAKTTNTH